MTDSIIQAEDVQVIVKQLNKELTEKEVSYIVKWYPDWQTDDPSSTWFEVIESMIYNTIDLRSAR